MSLSALEQMIVEVFTKTNRSIAASALSAECVEALCEGEAGASPQAALYDWGLRRAESGQTNNLSAEIARIKGSTRCALATADERIDYARAHMPCVAALARAFAATPSASAFAPTPASVPDANPNPAPASVPDANSSPAPGATPTPAPTPTLFSGRRVVVELICEPKTAVLLLVLAELGAQVVAFCDAAATDDTVVAALRRRGIEVHANSAHTAAEDRTAALALLDTHRPEFLIDDGANLARLLYMERPELVAGLKGIAEETTSGVRAFEAMQREGVLATPVIAVNDAPIKTCFDNAQGTGETCVAALLALTGQTACGRRVVVSGYGPVGEGVARRVRALGAQVTVVETSALAALRALHDGFRVAPLLEAAREAQWLISASGAQHAISLAALEALPDGAVVASAGGSKNEIALDEFVRVASLGSEDSSGHTYVLDASDPLRLALTFESPASQARTLSVLANGHGINYTQANGNPIEIMDLSFAGQLLALAELIEREGELPPQVLRLPDEASERIATLRLAAMEVACDTAGTASDWRATRFA